MTRRIAWVGLALGAGCAEEPPAMHTAGLVAEMRLIARDDATTDCTAVFFHRDAQVLLSGLDTVSVIAPGWLLELVPDTTEKVYSTQVPSASPGDKYIITVERAEERNAPLSDVFLPDGFAITAPSSWSRGTDLAIAWDPGPDAPADLLLTGPCVDATTLEVDDALGFATLPAGTVGGDGSCDVTLSLVRSAEGSLDNRLKGGSIVAVQERSVVLASTP